MCTKGHICHYDAKNSCGQSGQSIMIPHSPPTGPSVRCAASLVRIGLPVFGAVPACSFSSTTTTARSSSFSHSEKKHHTHYGSTPSLHSPAGAAAVITAYQLISTTTGISIPILKTPCTNPYLTAEAFPTLYQSHGCY